ncbi:hypothetical protein BDP55DRAFT_680175 [Colletotrichum godetiae]|uniref:Uncharacterized protein n=1 Tax=Colletotrichum godetiae TaxID=1209918 RepID=A0AAJ0EN27_9PEZI|nr:uncharacterized protein BDP55DRAFT_680175 [Colletotrichum godetiae]KAK1659340.1 hypothetical protein BDP55DRAFT_680175 [Colletotrichum godetiae]
MQTNLRYRQNCAQQTSYYVCSKNGFRGCCTVDPCDLSSCPDSYALTLSLSASSVTSTIRASSSMMQPTSTTPSSSATSAVTSTLPGATLTTSDAHRPVIEGVPLFIIVLAIGVAVPLLAFACFLWLSSRDQKAGDEDGSEDQSRGIVGSQSYDPPQAHIYRMSDIGLTATTPFTTAVEAAVAELPDKEWPSGLSKETPSSEPGSLCARPNLDATAAEVTQRKYVTSWSYFT